MITRKTRLAFAIGATVSVLSLSPALQAATVEEISAQMQAMQKQMLEMQKELERLRAEKRQPVDTSGNIVVTTEDYGELKEEVLTIREDLDDLDDRVMEPEKHAALDGLRWGGDFRFQAHAIDARVPDHINGLQMQGDFIRLLQGNQDLYMELASAGLVPQNPQDFMFPPGVTGLGEDFTFEQLTSNMQALQQAAAMYPEQFGPLLQYMAQRNFQRGYDFKDDIVRTSRLRLEMEADVGDNVDFYARLAMYKVWGDSTGVQVFNGQPTSINWDGTSGTYPNSDDSIHLERGYFTWTNIGGSDAYVSIGRRPSTNGVPTNFRNDEPRGGTPMGSLFNYQFDGITVGYHLNDYSTLRLCYGVGFESGWGNASNLQQPSDRLDDAFFYGLVWDVWDTPSMYVHLIAARAEDVTDGFPGSTIMPYNPITGEASPGPIAIRYEPSGTIGNIDLAGFVVTRNDGPFDYFMSYGWMETDPTDFFSPFGGMLSNPFAQTESESGNMLYVGGRYTFNEKKTKIGLEYNTGSKYWFNFAMAEDDYLAPKTSARGDVWEAYLTHRIRDRFIFKLSYMDYDYEYSGSGWLLGAPQKLDDTPVLGYPTYEDAQVWNLSLTAGF